MTDRRASLWMWIGVWAAPVAWALQHALGVELGLARCTPGEPTWSFSLRTWSVIVAVVAAVIAAAGLIAALAAARATRSREELPGSRIHFMAVMGITLSMLFLAIIVLNGLGTGLGDLCRQA